MAGRGHAAAVTTNRLASATPSRTSATSDATFDVQRVGKEEVAGLMYTVLRDYSKQKWERDDGFTVALGKSEL